MANRVYLVFRDEEIELDYPSRSSVCEKVFDSEDKAIEYIKSQVPENTKEIYGRWEFIGRDREDEMDDVLITYKYIAYVVE